jgi:hypothetical protein
MPVFSSSSRRAAARSGAASAELQRAAPPSVWRVPLVREIAVILLIKLILLFSIKSVWFDAPTVPVDGVDQVAGHLLGKQTATPTLPALEEKPR